MTVRERAALAPALSIWLAVLAADALQIPDPWWAAFSALIISNHDHQRVIEKGIFRIIGTVAGALSGYVLTTATAGTYAIPVVVIFFAVTLGIYKRYTSEYAYSWLLGALTAALVVSIGLENPDNIRLAAISRCLEIITGVVVASVVSLILLPPTFGEEQAAAAAKPSERQAIEAGLFGGVMALVLMALWTVLDIPSAVEVLITILAMISPDIAGTRQRSFQRVLGCTIGGLGGLALVSLSIDSFWLWSILMVAGFYLAARIHTGPAATAYIGTQMGFAYAMTMVTGAGPPDTIEPVVDRFEGIVIGVALLVLGNWIAGAFGLGLGRRARSA